MHVNTELLHEFCKKNIQFQGFINVPSDEERAVKDYQDQAFIEYSEMPIEQKRIIQDYRLITRRVIEY